MLMATRARWDTADATGHGGHCGRDGTRGHGATRRILGFARAHGLGLLSIWAIQRDNGGCPGTIDSDTCSGIKQPAWAFSHLLERFTR
jgi:hypothetical protein